MSLLSPLRNTYATTYATDTQGTQRIQGMPPDIPSCEHQKSNVWMPERELATARKDRGVGLRFLRCS